MIARLVAIAIAALLVAVAVWHLGRAGLLAGKAWAAPVLIERAWENGGRDGAAIAPWPWADSYPVARMEVPAKGITRYILAGDNMRNLAFGPVYADTSSAAVLYGHRDTHFEFLEDLEIGELVHYQRAGQKSQIWQVVRRQVMPADALYVPSSSLDPLLFLITCYPFSKLDQTSDERFVVWLRAVDQSDRS